MAREGRDADRYGALPAEESGSVRPTPRVIARLRKPHGQKGEVAIFPLVADPGSLLVPKARMYVVDETRQVLAGPLILGRRRAYHREWLVGFEGVSSRAAVEEWRDQFLAVEDEG
ncbi:MAG TPA: hypothetical protein VI159_01235 [Gemmatimonadales bacterium]|nr:hypothetical protein [Gemmatimonadales bacterium]HKR56063.1 hypothetical protein [Gemmatimonadales bacterium]